MTFGRMATKIQDGRSGLRPRRAAHRHRGSGGVDVARASASKTTVRHLWATGKGKFRTVGRFASATIRGTLWRTDDRCDGTLVHVQTGSVNVLDNKLQRTVTVRAVNDYLAKAP
jgi:hypothetical protein